MRRESKTSLPRIKGDRLKKGEAPSECNEHFARIFDAPRQGWLNLGGGCYKRIDSHADQ